MLSESFSVSAESDGISVDLESDSDSNTDIVSDTEMTACVPSTSHGSTSVDPFWTRTFQNLKPFNFIGMPNVNTVNAIKEIDFFLQFFYDNLINSIVRETKNFTENHLGDNPSSSKSVKFSDVTPKQMKAFFGLVILMGIIKKPNTKIYISTNEMLATPFFNKVISRDVFLNVLKFLHFTSDTNAKKLKKLGFLIEVLQNEFKTTYMPDKNICIDESLFAWKGRLGCALQKILLFNKHLQVMRVELWVCVELFTVEKRL
ncbi:PiggyBac transposable element-derived protein 4, partial [Stegodyphus mimosarum]